MLNLKRYLAMFLSLVMIAGFAGLAVCADSADAEMGDGDEDTEIVDPIADVGGYSSILYDQMKGRLPTSEAKAIVETSDGFIWIGSYSGLVRYDGNTFERIDSTTGIVSVVELFVDSRDRLWIGTNDNGVAMMDKGQYTYYKMADGLQSASVRTITEDDKGNIYLGTTQGVAVVSPDMTLTPVTEGSLRNAHIRHLIYSDGYVYGITMDGDLFTMKDGVADRFFSAPNSNYRCILPSREGENRIYIGTSGSEIIYAELDQDVTVLDTYDVSPLSSINCLKFVEDQIWICADNGIGMINAEGEFEQCTGIPLTNSIEDMIVDYQGNLWFTSSRQGVMKIVPNHFQDVFEKYGINSRVVNTTCLKGRELFIGTDNGLIIVDRDGVMGSYVLRSVRTASGEKIMAPDLISLLLGRKIRSIKEDSAGNLWISSYGKNCLIRLTGHNATCFTTDDGMPSERVRTVIERPDGTILAACTGGVAVIDGNEITEVYDERSGIQNTEVLTICEAENGDIIVGTDGGGIYIIRGTSVRHLGTENGLDSDVIMRVKKDRTRNLYWIVTSNSIAYMTGDYQITSVRGFPYSNNFDIYENSRDEIWVLSSNGIYVSPAEELIANGTITPEYYGMDNGLPCIATSNSYSALTSTGNLYIAGTTGVAIVNIENAFGLDTDIKLNVPYIEADGQMIYPDSDGRFSVPADVKKVTIYAYVFNYSLVNPQVSYSLEGFDDTKVTVRRNELSALDYTNLKGGKYTFVMSIVDSRGNEHNTMRIEIVKDKKIYEQIWFIVVVAILFIAILTFIVLAYVRYRIKKLRAKEEEQRILIREISEALAKTIDMKDKYTNGHSKRVADYTVKLAKELGYDEDTLEKFYNIALLHDIGKIGVRKEVLNKNGKLEPEEYDEIKSHTTYGHEVLKDISIMPELAIGAECHHERPDGRGYPHGYKLDKIPRVAQIIAVADTFDAMYSNRPYRQRMNFDKAVSIITQVSGTQLAPDVVDAFLRIKDQFRAPDDVGGGSTDDITNIRKHYDEEEAKHKAEEQAAAKAEGKTEEKPADKPEEKPESKEDKKPGEDKKDGDNGDKN